MKLICTLVAAAAVGLLAVGTSSSMSHPRLIGTVGPGFTISLKLAGKKVKKLKATTYRFKITDKSSSHNFRLRGPGYNKAITIKLKKGTYHYMCDPHASFMNGSFKVG